MKTYLLLLLLALIYLPIHLLLLLQVPNSMHRSRSDFMGAGLPKYRGNFGVNLFGWFTGEFSGLSATTTTRNSSLRVFFFRILSYIAYDIYFLAL